MGEIILPDFGPSRSNPFREYLRSRDGKKFRTQVLLSDAMSKAVSRVAKSNPMRTPEVLDGLVTALVSAVQATVPEDQWAVVSHILSDEVRDRLTVTGV